MKTRNIADIVDRQAPVFQSPAKTKELIYRIIMIKNLKMPVHILNYVIVDMLVFCMYSCSHDSLKFGFRCTTKGDW